MIYIDSKNKEHEVHTMSTNHLRNAIAKNGDEISRYNPALLTEMNAELATRTDNLLPADQVPKVNVCIPVPMLKPDNTPGQAEVSDDF